MMKISMLCLAMLLAVGCEVPDQDEQGANPPAGTAGGPTGEATPGTGAPGGPGPMGGGGATTEPAGGTQQAATVLGAVHRLNQDEIEMGRLAEQRGSTADVKQYGKTLVEDHTKLDSQLVALASSKGIDLGMTGEGGTMTHPGGTTTTPGGTTPTPGGTTPPGASTTPGGAPGDAGTTAGRTPGGSAPTPAGSAEMAKLQSLSGAQFDAAFLAAAVQAHERAISLVQQAKGRIQDPDITSFLDTATTKLQEHRDTAMKLQKQTTAS